MGRELKRVPLDFNWPIGKIWEGYLNPYTELIKKCHSCNGTGLSLAANALKNQWYGYAPFKPEDRGSVPFLPTDTVIQVIVTHKANNPYIMQYEICSKEEFMEKEAKRLCKLWNKMWCHHLNDADVAVLIKHNRLYDFTHIFTKETGWQLKNPPYTPTAREVNEWSLDGLGHDSISCFFVVEAECERLGYIYKCSLCSGNGQLYVSDELKDAYNNWKPEEPPIGEGFQLWNTTTEGEPLSPVFKTLEELCNWCADNATTFADYKATAEEWKKMLEKNLVIHKDNNLIFI